MVSEDAGPLSCIRCGFHLGVEGISGSLAYCARCADYVVTKIEQSSSDAVGGLIALGIGVVAALAFVGILGALFGPKE